MINEPTMAPLIEISHLDYSFGSGEAKTQTLFDNCLVAREGEIVFLNGPSGSGKTTLLTLIGALRKIQTGSLKVLGHEYDGLSQREAAEIRKNIGFIFQAHNLFGSLTAFQNVLMATELVGMPRSEAKLKIEQLLTRLGLGERIHYKPRSLSGGQKQRVAIARGLIHHPRIVLADEPTAALDEKSGREVVKLLREMADQDGCAVIIVTHDNRILDVADRVVNMVGGRIKIDSNLRQTEAVGEFLRRNKIFSELTTRTLSDLAQQVVVRTYATGEEIVVQGDQGREFFMIAMGAAEVIKSSGDQAKILTRLKAGDHFGEVSLMQSQPRNATVVATEPTTCYVLDQDTFRKVVESSDTLAAELRKAVFERI